MLLMAEDIDGHVAMCDTLVTPHFMTREDPMTKAYPGNDLKGVRHPSEDHYVTELGKWQADPSYVLQAHEHPINDLSGDAAGTSPIPARDWNEMVRIATADLLFAVGGANGFYAPGKQFVLTDTMKAVSRLLTSAIAVSMCNVEGWEP